MNGHRWILGLVLFLPWMLAARCHPQPDPLPDAGPVDAGPESDAAQPPVWNDWQPCRSASNRLAWVECDPVGPDTGTWVEACELARANGLGFGTACVRDQVQSRGDVASCGISCQ